MKMQPVIMRRIIRNVLISLLIYALPIFAMLFVFYIHGERPWKEKKQSIEQASPTSYR